MSDTDTPKWFENDDEADAFIDKNREKLIDKLGLGDLFTGGDPPKAGQRSSEGPSGASAKGAGATTPPASVSVPSNQMQDVMGALVAQSIGALKDAAVGHSASAPPAAPAPPKTRKHWLLGDIIDE